MACLELGGAAAGLGQGLRLEGGGGGPGPSSHCLTAPMRVVLHVGATIHPKGRRARVKELATVW